MPRIKLVIEYDGTDYNGWQFQKNQPSIQDTIERALITIFKTRIPVTGSGRTDAGVHARNQVAHLDIPETDLERLVRSLNGLLPSSIVVKAIEHREPDFHARYDAISRRYRYYISRVPTAIHRKYVWLVHYTLNLVLLQRAAHRICSVSDFRSFCKAGSEVNHHRCQIFTSSWISNDNLLVYEVVANRFLHGMVRSLVGTQIELARGRLKWNTLEDIIKSGDPGKCPFSAPAHGLFLEEVVYNY